MTVSQISEMIGITPIIGSLAATGVAILYSYPKPIIALASLPIISQAATSSFESLQGTKIKINALIPKFTLEHSVIAETYNIAFNFKQRIVSGTNINDNKFQYIKTGIKTLIRYYMI